jgi:hypothetical protein
LRKPALLSGVTATKLAGKDLPSGQWESHSLQAQRQEKRHPGESSSHENIPPFQNLPCLFAGRHELYIQPPADVD